MNAQTIPVERLSPRSRKVERTEPTYTNGWFQVGWSDELRKGDVEKLHFFGRELVMFRGEDGKASVVDAHCPHLGAHLGVGGKVVGNAIECPFHAWRFRGDGSCEGIPYAKCTPVKARLGAWTVREKHGLIFVHHHAEGKAPARDVADIPDFDIRDCVAVKLTFSLRASARDVMENSVDRGHFWHVHGFNLPEMTFRREGDELFISQFMTYDRIGLSIDSTAHYRMIEPGFHYVKLRPLMPMLLVSSLSPVDEHTVENRFTLFVQKTWGSVATEIFARLFALEMARKYREDIPIWENKIVREHPVLCDGDGPFMKLREWYAQFYG